MSVRMRELSVVVVRKHSVILMKATLIALLIREECYRIKQMNSGWRLGELVPRQRYKRINAHAPAA